MIAELARLDALNLSTLIPARLHFCNVRTQHKTCAQRSVKVGKIDALLDAFTNEFTCPESPEVQQAAADLKDYYESFRTKASDLSADWR
jgi:hypothetical protein